MAARTFKHYLKVDANFYMCSSNRKLCPQLALTLPISDVVFDDLANN